MRWMSSIARTTSRHNRLGRNQDGRGEPTVQETGTWGIQRTVAVWRHATARTCIATVNFRNCTMEGRPRVEPTPCQHSMHHNISLRATPNATLPASPSPRPPPLDPQAQPRTCTRRAEFGSASTAHPAHLRHVTNVGDVQRRRASLAPRLDLILKRQLYHGTITHADPSRAPELKLSSPTPATSTLQSGLDRRPTLPQSIPRTLHPGWTRPREDASALLPRLSAPRYRSCVK
jgi:hypothetical protein